MKIQVNNQNYWIDFQYDVVLQKSLEDALQTSCIISKQTVDGSQPMAGGRAIKNINDPHVKEIGRKIAFTNALKDFDRNTRAQFWSEYFKRKNYRKEYSYREVKKMIESLEDCHTIEHVRDTILSIKSLYGIKTEE